MVVSNTLKFYLENRIHDALKLYESVLNSVWFMHASIILFLNKKDLFLDKIQAGSSIRTAFPAYKGLFLLLL